MTLEIGNKIGKLTVQTIEGRNVKVLCDCGVSITFRDWELKKKRRCGKTCLKASIAQEGNKVGHLTVLKLLGGKDILVKCDCGTEFKTRKKELYRDNPSCKKGLCNPFLKNVVGQKNHKLTVVGLCEKRNDVGEILWRCLCECGNYTNIATCHLNTTKSCGCLIIKRGQEGWLMRQYIKHASKIGVNFDLSVEQFNSFLNKNCYYCGDRPKNCINVSKNKKFIYNGIDRKNTTIGYVLNNCVPCCKLCNFSKRKTQYKDFIEMTIKIANKFKDVDLSTL